MSDQIILSKQDYYLIANLLDQENGFSKFCSKELAKELAAAKILNSVDLPDEVVRIGSTVKIAELKEGKPIIVKLVSPSKADVKLHRISIQAPLGAALVGYRKGDTVVWKMPGGIKRFRILEVFNK